MNCLICGKPYALIRETEIDMARITGKAHVDCDGHSQYMAVMPSEVAQQARWYDRARDSWNEAADAWNQWDALDTDEKRRLAVAVAAEEANAQISGGTPSAASDCWQSGGEK